MNEEPIHTERKGKYTINIYPDYNTFDDANDWGYTGAELYANDRNFYIMPKDKKNLVQVITGAKTGTHFYFVDWSLYSSASNPVLRGFIDKAGATIEEMASEYFHNNLSEDGRKGWLEEYSDITEQEAITEKWLQDISESELPSTVMIAVEPLTKEQLKNHNASYYGSTGEPDKDADQCLEDWKTYLEGAYSFTIEDEDGEVVEAVGGYYGETYPIEKSYIVKEAIGIVQHLQNEDQKEEEQQMKEIKKGTVTMKTSLAEMLTSKNEQVKRLAKGIYKEITK